MRETFSEKFHGGGRGVILIFLYISAKSDSFPGCPSRWKQREPSRQSDYFGGQTNWFSSITFKTDLKPLSQQAPFLRMDMEEKIQQKRKEKYFEFDNANNKNMEAL